MIASAGAAIEQPGDVGMGETRQQLALPGEEGKHPRMGQATQELDRSTLPEVAIVALGQEDAPHPALPDLAGETPDAQHVAFGGRADRRARQRRGDGGGQPGGAGAGGVERKDLGSQLLVVGELSQPSGALSRGELGDRREQTLQGGEALRSHRPAPY